MGKRVRKKKKHHQTTLFRRILSRLTLPLLFLTFIFMVIQLTNRMNTMNEYYKIESRLVFEAIQEGLQEAIYTRKSETEIAEVKGQLERMTSLDRRVPIEIYDLDRRATLFDDIPEPWARPDDEAAEKSFIEKKNGKLYYLKVDKGLKSLVAYIPLEGTDDNPLLWVARVAFPLSHVEDALKDTRWSLAMIACIVVLTGLLIGHGLAKTIVNPIRSLNQATHEIMKGHLGKRVMISTGDEIEDLAKTFNHMSESLMRMKERAEDANPLTQLPGNQGILHQLKKRIYEKHKFVVFHADLDRFKAFNDYYGLAKGDEVIKQTAVLLKDAVREKGYKNDFVGHQGGDDFVMIVSLQRAKEVAEFVIRFFDERICRSFYKKEDYERGYVLAVDRRSLQPGEAEAPKAQIPLMGISLAGVSNAKKDFADYFDCLSRAVNVKSEVKKTIGSSYIVQE